MAKDLDLGEFGGTPQLDLSEFDQPAAAPASTARRAADTGLALGRGIIALPEAAVGVSNLMTGGRTGKAVERLGVRFKDAKQILTDAQSDEQKAADAAVQQADGFLPTVGAMVENPSTIVNAAAESAPSMLAGGALSQKLVNKGVSAITAGAAGEGIVSAGQAAEQVRQEGPTGFLTPKQAALAATSGAVTGVINRASGRLADKLGIGDVNTAMATGKLGGSTEKGVARRAAYGAVNEGVLQELPQSAQEQAMQNLALDKPVGEGVAQAAASGMLVGNLTGGAFGAVTPPSNKNGTLPGAAPNAQGGGNAPLNAGVKPPSIGSTEIESPGQSAPTVIGGQAAPTKGVLDVGLVGSEGAGNHPKTKAGFSQSDGLGEGPGELTSGGLDGGSVGVAQGDSPSLNTQNSTVKPPADKASAIGINRNEGPLSSAAATAVDTGADVVTQQQEVEKQKAEAADKEKTKPGADGKKPEPEAPAPVQPAPADPTAPITGPFTQAIHGAANVTPTPAPAVDPQGAAAPQGAGAQPDAPTAPGVGADQGPQGAGPVPAALPEPVTEVPPVTQPPTQESTNASTAEVIDPETGEITRPGPQGEGGDGVQRPADAVQPGADAEGTQRAADEPAAPASAGAPPEGGTAASVEPSEKDRRLKVVADTSRLSPKGGTRVGGLINGQVSYLGDPDRTMDGRKLMMAVDAALRAGATPQEVVDAATKPAPATPKPLPAEVEAKADEVMRAIGQIGGPIAITREQVVSLINARGIEAADKTIKGILDTIKRNNEAASASARAPKPPTPATPVDMGAHTAATSPLNDRPEPTQAQKEAGNYKKAHLVMNGLEISIENPEGSTRSGVDADGKPWSNTMTGHYGYIKRTTGSDGEQQDVYVKPGTPLDYAGPVFVVDQIDPKTGKHDEFKSMVGYKSPMEARKAYMSNYAKDWAGLKSIKTMTWDEFKAWLGGEAGKKPLPRKGKQADGGTVRGMDYTGRPIDGKPVNAGDIFATSSGRQTTPYPSSKRQQAASQWLIDNAIAEATSRDDTMNAAVFGNEKPMKDGSLPPASQDSMLEYLFGQQPAVPKSILKPLAPASNAGGAAATQEQAAADKEPTSKAPAKPTGGKNLRAAAYEKNPLLTFLAQHGLFHDKDKPGSQKAEFSPDKQVMVMGYGPVFRKTGMKPDLLVQLAIEDGYLPPDSDESELVDLIRRAIGGERIAPMYAEGAAETEMQKRMQAIDDLRELDDNESAALDPDIFAQSNTSTEDAMRALGFSDQEIHDATTQGPSAPQEGRQGRGEPDEAQAAGPGEGAQGGPRAPPDEAEPEGLTADEANTRAGDLIDRHRAEFAKTPSGMTADQFHDYQDRRRDADKAVATEILKLAGNGDGLLLPWKSGTSLIALHKDPRTEGAWRTTTFLPDMTPAGHMEFNTPMEAAAFFRDSAKGKEAEGLTAPTRADVIGQQERTENSQALDDKAQIDREAAGQTLTAQTAPEQRTDNTGDMFAVEKAQAVIDKRNASGTKSEGPSLFDQPAEPEPAPPAATKAPTEADALRLPFGEFASQAQKLIDMPGGSWLLLDNRRASYETGSFNVVFSWGNGKWSAGETSKTPADAYATALRTWTDRGNAKEDFKPADKAEFVSGVQGPDLLEVAAAHKVGDLVKLTKPGVNGRINIAGTVTKILPDGRLEIRTQQDGYMTVAPSELGHKPTAAPATTATARSRPRDTITFKTPIKGPSGSSLVSYTWQWRPMDVVDSRGEDRTVRISDWDKADINAETGREIVHQFVVAAPDGSTQTVSAETAVRLLGFAGNEAAPFKSAASAAKTLARLRMQAHELGALLDQFTKDHDAVKAMRVPAPTSERNAEGWFEMGDAKVRQLEPGPMIPERLRALTSAWRDNRLQERGWKSGEATKDLLGAQATDINQRIKRAERKLAALNDSPAPVTPPAKPGEVENFGETLPPARRNMAAKLDEALTNDDIANRPLSEIWPLAENEAIEDNFAAAVAHAARAEIPSKPRVAYKLKNWVTKVQALRELGARIVSGRVTRERFIELVPASLKDWLTKVMLLEQISRDQWNRIEAVEERPDSFTYDGNGKQVESPMVRVKIDGRSHWLTGDSGVDGSARGTLDGNKAGIMALLSNEAPEERMQFEVRQRRGGKVFVNKKGDSEYRALMEFDTAEDARKAITGQYDDLVAAWDAIKARDNITERDLRSAENRPRVGKDHRNNRDVTPEDFQSKFGFRGGEFGKWVQQGKGDKERQAILNSAYDALMDLANIAGIPPKAISLNGTLGIAFGSRGTGWASAHFEPSNLVINLTKTRGAGALAHEWFHGLDNYFSRMRRGGAEEKFTGGQTEYRNNNYITHRPEPMMVPKNVMGGRYLAPMTLGKLRATHEARKDKTDAYNPNNWQRDPKTPEGVRPEVEARFAALVDALNESPMTKRARTLDGTKSGEGYWSRTLERAARAFESYVIAKMHEDGYHNDFLVNVKKSDETGKAGDRYPYLMAGEVKPIAEAFDALFDTVQTREDASGNVSLYEPTEATYTAGYGPAFEPTDQYTADGQPAASGRPGQLGGVSRTVRALGVARELQQRGATALVGQRVQSAADLAELAQVYRNPRYEVFRIFFTKADTIVHASGVTARLPGQTPVFPNGVADGMAWMREQMQSAGADGYYILHNHPSGNPIPSFEDVELTRQMAAEVPGMRAHVVINGNKFSSITPGKDYYPKVATQDLAKQEADALLRPAVPSPVLGREVSSADQLMGLVKNLQRADGMVLVVAASSDALKVRGLIEVPSKDLATPLRAMATMRRYARLTGSAHILLYGERTDLPAGITERLIQDGFVTDVVYADGGLSQRAAQGIVRRPGVSFGRDTWVGGTTVSEGGTLFARAKRTGGVHMDDAEAIIASIREALPTAPPIIPLETIAQAPADLRKFIRDAGAQDDFEAAYHNGKIFILPSNVGSTSRLQFLLAHHEIRHHGLASLLGPRKNAVLFAIHATNANVRAAAAEQIRRGYATSKVLATEEALADMPADELVKLNGWDKIVAAVREWLRGAAMRLRRAGLGNIADAIDAKEWTDKDVAALVARAEGVSRGGSAKYATEGTVFGQDGDMPAFYSALSREISASAARAQPAQGWISSINGLVKAGKIKREELEWSGVLDWLKMQGAKVTREQLVEYLDANGVRVEETVLGATGMSVDGTLEAGETLGGTFAVFNDTGSIVGGTHPTLEDAQSELQSMLAGNPAKYASYQLPGGSNYREILLTLPEPDRLAKAKQAGFTAVKTSYGWQILNPGGEGVGSGKGETADQALESWAKLSVKDSGGRSFRSGHWDQPNVLAHIRVNDRTDADGRKVLFVEEIQSDWGQEGKKKGFVSGVAATAKNLSAVPDGDTGAWYVYPKSRTEDAAPYIGIRTFANSGAAAIAETSAHPWNRIISGDKGDVLTGSEAGKTPSAPFVTNTDKWLTLALKRIVKMAVDEGYDRVAFVNGDQSAARYDLSKQVDSLEWLTRPTGAKMVSIAIGSQPVQLIVSEDGKVVAAKGRGLEQADGKMLDEVLGKDAASQIMAGDKGQLSDLKVGGEGMKAFYDKIVPNTLKDVLRKVGGGALETVNFDDGNRFAIKQLGSDWRVIDNEFGTAVAAYQTEADAQEYVRKVSAGLESKGKVLAGTQPGFTITPAMRSKVAGGLPLFARGDKITEFNSDGPAKEFERYKRLVDQVGQEYTAKGSTMTFEEFTAKVKPLQDKMWEAHFKLEKWKAGRPATSTEEVFPGFQEIPIGTRILATHGLKYPEPTMGTVVGRRGLRMGEKAYVLPEVDFGDGDGRAVLPGDIKEVFAGPRTMFARGGLDSVTDKINTTTKTAGNTAAHYRGLGLQALGRRQITELYGDILPQLGSYSTLMAQMDADKNEAGAEADQIAQDWGKLKDERQLAELMHDATLAQMDPEKPLMRGDDPLTYEPLRGRYAALSPEAKKVYVDARDTYRTHHENVRKALRDRIERSELRGQRKAELLKQMDDEFYQSIKGVYFPLARFGDYVVIVRDPTGKTLSVNRAESINEAEALQVELRKAYPEMTVGKVLKAKEFNAGRDAVGRGFMQNLYEVLGKQDMDEMQRADMEDMLGQLYLSALPDLSWAKHGIHRKGTPGFSQDARRAFAQNTFHGARYLAKVRYSDLLENELSDAQKQVDALAESESFDSVKAQQVIDEMVKRHDAAMNPAGNSLSTALTSIGFVFHLGLSPASAVVNLTQTALVAYPIMGAKWGFDKAAAALLKASQQAAANRNDISAALSPEEKRAYDEAVRSGVIDVTMAHDLAGISQGEDAKVSWKLRPVMRWASFLFHHAEKFNRQATFVAAYRLAREAGTPMAQAYEQAVKATYDGHFDYSATNRPRIMQGNAAKVILLFKQYGQNMVYTLSRQAYLSAKGKNQFERAQARKALGGLLTMHAAAAGVLGLPMVSTLLAAASMLGGDDDEPWDAEVALRNMLADALGDQAADVLARGLSRLTPWDISGRVGLDKLILPDIQEGLEGQRLGESAMAAALGPVAGIGVALLKGMQEASDGNWARGLEAMAPSLLRGPARAVRYASEGAIDKTGKPIVEDVNDFGIVGQALGFSPSDVRLATEAKSAVHQADARLAKRRATLMRHYAMAVIAGDEEGAADAREEILAFNERNPQRRINPLQMARSVATRRKQIAESQGGVYLPKTHRDAMEAGQFGMP